MKRRSFLRQSGLVLAALGCHSTGLLLASDRSHQVLAQPTRRKLALLVGINQYDSQVQFPPLAGCLTDVELQRELLIHRFGFQPNDIQVLTQQEATYKNMATAFTTHLAQAKAGDVVVVHFSGYGRRIWTGGQASSRSSYSLIPFDSTSLNRDGQELSPRNDLPEELLFLWLRSLPTEQIVTILDCSYTYPGTPLIGSLRVRSRPEEQVILAAPQQQLLEKAQTLLRSPERTELPGVLVRAAHPLQVASETQWHGFSAGLLTYTFTQHLWSTSPGTTLYVSLQRTLQEIWHQSHQQQPDLSGRQSHQPTLPAYPIATTPIAAGVVLSVDETGRGGKLWLGGLPAQVLAHYGINSILTLLPDRNALPTASQSLSNPSSSNPSSPEPQLQIQTLTGLTAKAQLLSPGQLQPGQLCQESLRILPHAPSLAIALDPGLERIERVDAISALSALPQISPVLAGEQPGDYLFAKIDTREDATDSPAPAFRYGLFSPGRELLPNTIGEPGEAIKAAVRRLSNQLSLLLADKLLSLTINDASSRLEVSASLELTTPTPQTLLQLTTPPVQQQSAPPPELAAKPLSGRLSLPSGSSIQLRVHNCSDRPLYVLLLGLDSGSNPFIHYTPKPQTLPPSSLVLSAPPGGETEFPWRLRRSTLWLAVYLLFSPQPFSQTIATLESGLGGPPPDTPQTIFPSNFLAITQAVLQDLHQSSGFVAQTTGTGESFAFDVNHWATLCFNCRVGEAGTETFKFS